MSWDVIIINAAEHPANESQWNDGTLPSLGTQQQLQEKISALYPYTDWTDPSYAHLEHENFVGHISIDNTDAQGATFMLHVYGGNNPYDFIVSLFRQYSWCAYDTTLGEYINLQQPDGKGWEQFRAFRRRIAEKMGGEVYMRGEAIPKKKWWKFW